MKEYEIKCMIMQAYCKKNILFWIKNELLTHLRVTESANIAI